MDRFIKSMFLATGILYFLCALAQIEKIDPHNVPLVIPFAISGIIILSLYIFWEDKGWRKK